MLNAENELKKWAPVLEHTEAPAINDSYKKAVTAKLLENTEKAIQEERAHSSFSLNEDTNNASISQAAAGDGFDPILISLVRRAMPNLIAYDVAGVQPMSGPTGLIFSMTPRYESATAGAIGTDDTDAFNEEPGKTKTSGTGLNAAEIGAGYEGTIDGGAMDANTESVTAFGIGGAGIATSSGEDAISQEMGFTIDKTSVVAKTRQLKAEYTMELAQDLKAVHGLDAESELANILSGEILAEINREVIRTIGRQAKYAIVNSQSITAGTDDVQAAYLDMTAASAGAGLPDGRWKLEKFQDLAFQLEKQANLIAVDTRRGKGNFAIVSPNVASALAGAGSLTYGVAAIGGGEMNVDATGNTFAGTLNGKMKIYVDPYATKDYAIVGYKGDNAYDAGIFYCPYVPLTMVRAVGESTFQPKIAFKTRYGMVANPFTGALGTANNNSYYRVFGVKNI